MKLLFTTAFLLFLTLSHAQQAWVKTSTDTTSWKNIDTLNKTSETAGWVYGEWANAECLIPDSATKYVRKQVQQRLGKTSGFVQQRSTLNIYYLKPKEKTEFEKYIDSASKN